MPAPLAAEPVPVLRMTSREDGTGYEPACRCGHHYEHHKDRADLQGMYCAYEWQDSDGFPWACQCGEYLP